MEQVHCSTLIWRSERPAQRLTQLDWDGVAAEFQLPEALVADARKHDLRARLAVYDNTLFLSIRSWVGYSSAADDLDDVTQESDVLVGAGFLVQVCERSAALDALPPETKTSDLVLYAILDAVLDGCYPAMDALDEEIDALEVAVFSSDGLLDIKPALRLKKRLLLLRQTVSPLRDVTNQLLRLDHPVLTHAVRPHLQDAYDRALRLTEQIDLHREIVTGVLEAIMAQTSNRLNQQMKRLTAIAALALPVTAITGFFGMNIGHFDSAPAWTIYVATATMFGASGFAWLYFQKRGYW